jgi:outer membrane lipoprotein LolB
MHQIFKALIILYLPILMLTSCSNSSNNYSQVHIQQTPQQRASDLAYLQQWHIKGKIAFLEVNNRNSFSLVWRVDEKKQTQHLNLTSYLGINALELESTKDNHKIKIEGKTYQGSDLEALITSLTGLTLPAKALTYWLKGLPYNEQDKLVYQASTQLPKELTSYYNKEFWQVSYSGYKQISNYSLATKISIKKDDLLIKIAINEWSIK